MDILDRIQCRAAKTVSTSPVKRGWESWGCLVWRRFRGISLMSINTWKKDAKRMESGSAQWCHYQNKRQWAQTSTPLTIRKQFCAVRVLGCCHRMPRGCALSSLENMNPSGCSSGHPPLGVCDWAGVGPDGPTLPTSDPLISEGFVQWSFWHCGDKTEMRLPLGALTDTRRHKIHEKRFVLPRTKSILQNKFQL